MKFEQVPNKEQAPNKEQVPKIERQSLEQFLRFYQSENLPRAIFDIYEKAKTPHESMIPVSASSEAGPPVGIENIRNLVKRIEDFAERAIKRGDKEDIEDAKSALAVLRVISEEAKADKPDAQKVDKEIARFIQDRIEKFFGELDKRSEAADGDLEKSTGCTKGELRVPLEIMRDFNKSQRADEFFKGTRLVSPADERASKMLYKFWKKYPAVFFANILRSIDLKTDYKKEFDPMFPLSAL